MQISTDEALAKLEDEAIGFSTVATYRYDSETPKVEVTVDLSLSDGSTTTRTKVAEGFNAILVVELLTQAGMLFSDPEEVEA